MKVSLFVTITILAVLLFFPVKTGAANPYAQHCLTINTTLTATNWPGGNITVSCNGWDPPEGTTPYCPGSTADIGNGESATLDACDCLLGNGRACLEVNNVPEDCTVTPADACGTNGETINHTLEIQCREPISLPSLPPTPSSSCTISGSCTNLTCSFIPTYSIDEVAQTNYSVNVDYGDNQSTGNRSTPSIPSHTYSSAGSYDVTLQAKKADGTGETTCTTTVTPVSASAPGCNDNDVSLTVTPNTASLGNTVTLSIAGDASTYISDNFGGGLSNCSGPWNNKTCRASNNGNYTWTHNWKHCSGGNCSGICSKTVSYSIGTPGTWSGSCVNRTTFKANAPGGERVRLHAKRCDDNNIFFEGQFSGQNISVTPDVCFRWYSEDCGVGCENQRGVESGCTNRSTGSNPYAGNEAGIEIFFQYPDGTDYDGFALPANNLQIFGKRLSSDLTGGWLGKKLDPDSQTFVDELGCGSTSYANFYFLTTLDGSNNSGSFDRGFCYDSQRFEKKGYRYLTNIWQSGCQGEECDAVQEGYSMLWPRFPNTFKAEAFVIPAVDGNIQVYGGTFSASKQIRGVGPNTRQCNDADSEFGHAWNFWNGWTFPYLGNITNYNDAFQFNVPLCTTNFAGGVVFTVFPPVELNVIKQLTNGNNADDAGSITSTDNDSYDNNISCGSDCSKTYYKRSPVTESENTAVTLTATPASGYAFSHWENCGNINDNTCTIYMDNNKTVIAYFIPNPYTLTVIKAGYAAGTISGSSTSIVSGSIANCGSTDSTGTCQAIYTAGSSVDLTADLDPNRVFVTWSSGCDADSPPDGCKVTMNSDKTITATFSAYCSYLKTTGGDVYSGAGINMSCSR